MSEPVPPLGDLEEQIGYRFRDQQYLVAALTHASAVEASQPRAAERLEFLGDAVLGLVFADLLVARYPAYSEGRLSKCRAMLVNTDSFAAKARELGLNRWLTLGRGEEKTGGREKTSILAAVYEAVMGAVFLDAGYDAVRTLAHGQFADAIERIGTAPSSDAKTALQELCQDRFRLTPVYRVVSEAGPDHARHFVVDVVLGDSVLARGDGRSKRAAEQDAARHALDSVPSSGTPESEPNA